MHSHHTHQWLSGTQLLIAIITAVAAALYFAAVRRLRRRGDTWPARYVCSFGGGCLTIAVAATAPLPVGPFTDHMTRHLLLGMVAPLLVVLGRPATVAFRALGQGCVRKALLSVLHFPPAGLLVVPAAAAIFDMGFLWWLYRTGLFAQMHDHAALGAVIHVHMFVAGLLFSAAICQLDPVRRRFSLASRAVVLLIAGAAHAILAKTLYAHPPPDTHFAEHDLQVGAQIMYYGGDLVEVALASVLAVQWYTAVGRTRRRPRVRTSQAGAGLAPRGLGKRTSNQKGGRMTDQRDNAATADFP